MNLQRSSSDQSRSNSPNRNGQYRISAHPGFLSTSPKTNSAHRFSPRSSDESNSSSPFFQNTVNPASSHLISSRQSNSGSNSKNFSATSTSKCTAMGNTVSKNYGQYSQKTAFLDRCMENARNFTKHADNHAPRISDTVLYQINVLKEKYSKLKEDYNAKLEEVSSARVELEGALKEALVRQRACEKAEKKADDLVARLKEVEGEKFQRINSRDKILEMENQLTLIREKHRESLDDVAEAKKILKEQLEAVENTRRLYLETEQLAEEQNKKMEYLLMENQRLTEQKTLGVEQAREQFQMQVLELRPLEDTVSRLNDRIMLNREKKRLAEKKAESVNLEIGQLSAKNREIKTKLATLKKRIADVENEKTQMRQQQDAQQVAKNEATDENYALRAKIRDLEELNTDKEVKIRMKVDEVDDLSARLETLREECARQISANKMALTSDRKSNLKRLSALEKDLAHTKASENGIERERDEIRSRLEQQIQSLGQNLVQARDKIKLLQESLGQMNKDRNMNVVYERARGK